MGGGGKRMVVCMFGKKRGDFLCLRVVEERDGSERDRLSVCMFFAKER